MIATNSPSTLPHDSMLHTRLEGQQTGDSSASDGGSATTHTTDTTMPSSVSSVGSPGGSCGGGGARRGEDVTEAVGQLPPTTSVPAAARKYHRHMARSAAKRQSVASLPSIRDLQLQFSGGTVQHRAGAGAGIRPSPLSSGAQGREDDEASVRRNSKPWKDVQLARVSPAEARREAQALARTLSAQWALDTTPEDVRSLFVDTARAVRRVRTLSLSLVPPERRVSGPQRPVAAFSTPSRPSGVGQGMPRVVFGSSTPPARDPGAPMRRAALDLLGNLRALEERLRDKASGDVPAVVIVAEQSDGELVDSPVEDSPSLSSMDRRDSTRSLSPSPGRQMRDGSPSSIISYDEDVWLDDDGFDVNAAAREAEAAEAHTLWEDRLVAEGRTYAATSGESWAADSAPTLAAARRWVEAVSRVFGDAVDPAAHAWVANTGMERVHAFLVSHLSREHAALLPGPGAKELLERLSDGYLLVQAYNASLLASPRPWGFIPDEDVYDTLAAGPDTGREWTFRRVGNLTCWAAALRTRFNLPIAMAAGGAVAPTLSRRRSVVPSVEFDPLAVAKRTGAWDEALRAVLLVWVAEAADELRGGNREPDVPEEAAEREEATQAEAERKEGPL